LETKIRNQLEINPVIIDLGIGNVGSLTNAIKFLGLNCAISNKVEEIEKATHLLLPGVGAYDTAMLEINRLGLHNHLNRLVVEESRPLIGICLGMQLLFESSEEGLEQGLGFVSGKLEKLPADTAKGVKVPHAGFSEVTLEQRSGFFKGMGDKQSFYFTHSFAVRAAGLGFETATCDYGFPFTAAFKHKNIYGAQFHPEKSQSIGLRLLANFFEGGTAT